MLAVLDLSHFQTTIVAITGLVTAIGNSVAIIAKVWPKARQHDRQIAQVKSAVRQLGVEQEAAS